MPPPVTDQIPSEQIASLVDLLVRGREDVRSRHEAGASGIDTTRRLSDLVDRLMVAIFRIATERVPAGARSGFEITVAATGGYGRRRLAPFSDIDVTFIVSEEDDPWLDGVAKEMFFLITRVFTDGAGLRIGYAYRTLNDLEDVNTQTQTALLDARWVVGDRPLFYRFREELIRYIRPAIFVWHKLNDRLDALKQHGDSVYLVEPNVKMGAGGLRDLHTAEWLAKATIGTGLEDAWGRLRTIGMISEDEFHAITAGREFLLRVRNGLHWLAGDELDALTRERQPEVAAQLGYRDTSSRTGVQGLMADYYQHAATIQRISRKVAARSLKHPLRLSDGLVMKGGEITPTDLSLMEKEPSAALGVLCLAQRYDFPLSPEVEEMIGDYAAREDVQLDDPDSHRLFLHILRHPKNVYPTLREMADLGLLPLVIPAYGPLLRLLPTEASQTYTVGEHSLRVVRELERMRAEHEPDHAAFTELFRSLESPEILMLAALLYDLGRVRSPGRHAVVGAQMVETIGYNLGLDEAGVSMLSFLVLQHDLMADLARSRDPEQPETAASLAASISRPDWLVPLYLLSVADLRTYGSEAWVHVLLDALTRLYDRTVRVLERPEAEPPTAADAEDDIRRIERQLTLRQLPEKAVREYCADMPASYLLNTEIEKIIRHMGLLERLSNGPLVDCQDEKNRPWTVMTIMAPDAPGLLAKIAGVLYAHDVSVHSARVYTREGATPIALDELLVEAHNRPLPAAIQAEITRDLVNVLTGRSSLADILSQRGMEMGPGEPVRSVHLHNEMSETFTVIEVEMPDEKGLLYRLASAMTALKWSIHNARIGTRAGEARDVFYVTDQHGEKIGVDDLHLHVALSDGLAAGPPVA